MIGFLRRNIGIIIASIGFFLLCIMTFGDIGEILSEEYWENVANNITSISFVSIGLTLILASIKQGLAEQALQRGLNSENTTRRYKEHKDLIVDNNNRMVYLPYFLQMYNRRHTDLRKRDFLIANGYCSEQSLYSSNNKRAIRKYNRIQVRITAADIKWSTVELKYDKNGRILTLDEYRTKRLISGVITSLLSMIGVTFLTGGLFFSPGDVPIWQKFVKLMSYIFCIAISGVFTVIKEYEKGAFGVPNELEEINEIWHEFSNWTIPDWVKKEIDVYNRSMEVNNEREERVDSRTNIQEEPVEDKGV